MMNDLKDMLEMLSEKGYTPSEFMVLYELSCKYGFKELSEEDQKTLVDNAYLEYLRNDFTSLEEAINNTVRTCTECGRIMIQGYCVGDGLEYYCNGECLHKHYTKDEYEEMYRDNDAYYTEWSE